MIHTNTIQATITVPAPTDQFLFDLFVTAMEGGIGYWAYVTDYNCLARESGDVFVSDDLTGFSATVTEDDELDGRTFVVNRDVMRKAVERIVSGDYTFGGRTPDPRFAQKMVAALLDPDHADFDAGDADNVVQIGLFGDVMYG